MSESGLDGGAELLRPPRRLLPLLGGLELLLTLLESAAVVVPVVGFFPAVRQHPQLLAGLGLLIVAWLVAAAVWLSPILHGVAPHRALAVYRLARRLPRRLLLLRLAGWAVLATWTALLLRPELGWLQLGALLSICLVHSFGAAVIRWGLQQRLLRAAIVEMHLEPSWVELQADTLLDRLVEVALLLGATAAGFLGVFVPLSVPISVEQFLLLETTFPSVAILLGLLWYRLVVPRLAVPLLAYLRDPAEDPAARQQQLLQATENAHRLPARLALTKLAFFSACGLLLFVEALALLGYSLQQALLLLAAIVIVTVGTAIAEMIWSRSALRPLTAHLLAQPGAAELPVRTPSLRRKLLLSFGGVLVFTVILPLFWTYLQILPGGTVRGSSLTLVGVIFFFATIFSMALGVVWLTSSDLSRPLATLEQRATEMAQGKLDQRLLPAGEFDEVGRLTAAFEIMRRALQGKIRTIEKLNLGLEAKVQERTAELERSNGELSATLAALQQAQHRLVLSEKMASVGQLVAGIAHEINNPLNAVVNTVEPLAETVRAVAAGAGGESAEDLEAMLRVIRSAAQRTQRIVQALRNYTRQDGEAVTRMDLHADIEESLALLQHQLRGVRLERELRAGGELIACRGQLNQAVVNLITNAAAAVENQPDGRLTVRTRDQDDQVVIEVEDNGPGIPQAVLPRIFDPFFTTKEAGKGTGLGLSITHDIVARHGGRLDVQTSSSGTTFTISLPRQGGGGEAAADSAELS